MLAVAGVAVEVGLVIAGVIVVLGALWGAGRSGPGSSAGSASSGPRRITPTSLAQPRPRGAPDGVPAASPAERAPAEPARPLAAASSAGPAAGPVPARPLATTQPAPERRTVARAPVVRPVILRRTGAGVEQRTFALDIGVGGVLLAGPADLAIGERLDLQIDLGEALVLPARVVRETTQGMKGLEFESVAAADRERLERFVGTAPVAPQPQPG